MKLQIDFIIISKDIKLNLDDDNIFATLDVSDDILSPRSLIPQVQLDLLSHFLSFYLIFSDMDYP
jgi:hypothetical protein